MRTQIAYALDLALRELRERKREDGGTTLAKRAGMARLAVSTTTVSIGGSSAVRSRARGRRDVVAERPRQRRRSRYVRRLDKEDRARLVEQHLEMARRAAAAIYPRVKNHVDFEELVAHGQQGLAEAAQRYDPSRKAAFPTFAWYRVNGAIIDGLRRATNMPRRVWARLLALRAANEYCEAAVEREVDTREHGIDPPAGAEALAAIRSRLSAIRTMYLTSLEAIRDSHDPVAEPPAAEEQIDAIRLSARLRSAIARLPVLQRELITKHYWEDKNLLEAGTELGISKSWASRLHVQAVERLRGIVDDSRAAL